MSYTDGTLATFMATQLGATGRALSLTAASDEIVSAVGWVAAILGMPVASMTDNLKTMTVATWRAWVAAKAASANDKDLKAGSTAIELSQRFDHIERMLCDSLAAAMRYTEVVVAVGTAGGWTPMPYAGGISESDRQNRESNTDRSRPFFTRTLHQPLAGMGQLT